MSDYIISCYIYKKRILTFIILKYLEYLGSSFNFTKAGAGGGVSELLLASGGASAGSPAAAFALFAIISIIALRGSTGAAFAGGAAASSVAVALAVALEPSVTVVVLLLVFLLLDPLIPWSVRREEL